MKLHSPAAERNREPILEIVRRVLPARGTVLSIASGAGVHDVHFAHALPHLIFRPSDIAGDALDSIRARRTEAALPNLEEPLCLDVFDDPWPIASADAIININMIHIAPWSACQALLRGASRTLARGSVLYLYGPMIHAGRPLEASNVAFDRSLRETNPEWGLRKLADIEALARDFGFVLEETIAMPANNTSCVFRRA